MYIIRTMKRFEYDENKSKGNREKHGIDCKDAQKLWLDPERIEIESNQNLDERRILVVGLINGIYWTAIVTMRNENIRIISVRRSRKNEVVLYEENVS